jgi:hypothetical protein
VDRFSVTCDEGAPDFANVYAHPFPGGVNERNVLFVRRGYGLSAGSIGVCSPGRGSHEVGVLPGDVLTLLSLIGDRLRREGGRLNGGRTVVTTEDRLRMVLGDEAASNLVAALDELDVDDLVAAGNAEASPTN